MRHRSIEEETKADFLVIGGGIIGLTIAREIQQRHRDAVVCLIEKESTLGQHASGRNSGVLHAGFYYTPDSLKARFTREGNRMLTEYCDARNLAINRCGKLVVARNEEELDSLDELIRRGNKNGVILHELSVNETKELEPRAKTYKRAIFSPTTSSVDPIEVMRSLTNDAVCSGIHIKHSTEYRSYDGSKIYTNRGRYRANYVVNAAGLQADRIARDFGFSKHYKILPFKGLYLYSDEQKGSLKRHVYPVPDLRNPFLGVHQTVSVDGNSKIGPTALPAFWREQYAGFSRFSYREAFQIASLSISLLIKSNFEFKRLALQEFTKKSRRQMVKLAGELVEDVQLTNYKRWGRPGIRAQLLDLRTRTLEMDFVLEGDSRSIHVLNAVSPGFTCSMPFAQHVCAEIEKKYLQ